MLFKLGQFHLRDPDNIKVKISGLWIRSMAYKTENPLVQGMVEIDNFWRITFCANPNQLYGLFDEMVRRKKLGRTNKTRGIELLTTNEVGVEEPNVMETDPFGSGGNDKLSEISTDGVEVSNSHLTEEISQTIQRKRGRPRKNRNKICPKDKVVESSPPAPKKRGRKPIGGIAPREAPATAIDVSNPSLLEGASCLREPQGRYPTRSKKVWLLGKVLGLEFEGTDEQALLGLDKVLKSFLPNE